jgi:hypothetical protein
VELVIDMEEQERKDRATAAALPAMFHDHLIYLFA